MLETDVPETINECVESVHKAGAIVSDRWRREES
jgi:hypothetical protein